MTTKQKAVFLIIALAAAFATGRWLAPTKIVTETKTVEVEKKTDDKQTDTKKNTHKKITRTIVVKPDGSKVITEVVTDESTQDTKQDEKSTDEVKKDTDTTKEVSRSSDKVTILALGGVNISNLSTPVYGGSISKPILGPVACGVFGLTNGLIGVGLGLSF